ncbi:hypothetical protein Tco_0801811 [Tanacetum coccineum]|uniref:Uncharacterized protein n=1 Tax=Tanacetum coccineum TaxID=301880 RepID=A0ABQ4ZX89_9ASTR
MATTRNLAPPGASGSGLTMSISYWEKGHADVIDVISYFGFVGLTSKILVWNHQSFKLNLYIASMRLPDPAPHSLHFGFPSLYFLLSISQPRNQPTFVLLVSILWACPLVSGEGELGSTARAFLRRIRGLVKNALILSFKTTRLLLPPASIELSSCLHNSSALLEKGASYQFLSEGIGLKLLEWAFFHAEGALSGIEFHIDCPELAKGFLDVY